jgi:NAD(P)-dependent dehydrogenase (short-subunit alcohol dehydrogenase family)
MVTPVQPPSSPSHSGDNLGKDQFSPRTVVVLGASGGLGAVIAETFLARGDHVALTYRRQSTTVDQMVATHDVAARSYQLDLRDEEECRRVVDRVASEFGGVDCLIYAAGPHVPMIHLSKVTPAQFREQILDDAVAFFNVAQPTLPHLRATHGNIVAVTTAATSRFPVRDGLSSVPKGAVEALVRAIAVEEGRFGVRANCVGPGMLTDGMAERLISSGELDERSLEAARANIPLHRFGTAVDIAEAVHFLASDRAAFITGQKIDIDGGYST